jgi:hypothetical protein
MVDGYTLMSTGGDTRAIDGCTKTSIISTQTVDGDTLTCTGVTLMVGGYTRTVDSNDSAVPS